nr:hypothetical protein [Amycolatopsis sp. PS_44_ISF1]
MALTEPLEWFATIDFAGTAAGGRIAEEFWGWAPELTGSDAQPVPRAPGGSGCRA